MKIIKHGNTYVPPRVIKCGCGCEFEIEDIDIYKNYLRFAQVYQYCVKCPECHRDIILDEQYDEESPEEKMAKQFEKFQKATRNVHR